MSYAICQVIYGAPLTEKVNEYINDIEKHDRADDPEEFGFETLYSGSGSFTPGYCGVILFEFDECETGPVRWSEFVAQANDLTDEQKTEAQAKFNELPEEIRAILAEEGVVEPDIFMVWHTS